MKRQTLIIAMLLTSLYCVADESPQPNVTTTNDEAPSSEIINYNGEEYLKRYNYEMSLGGYAATLYRTSEVNRIDSINRVTKIEARFRKQVEREDYRSAAGHIENVARVKRIANRVLKKRELERLEMYGSGVRIYTIADSLGQVLYLNISYVGGDSIIDRKMIKLQEWLRQDVDFVLPDGPYFTMVIRDRDSLIGQKSALLQDIHDGKFDPEVLKEKGLLKYHPPGYNTNNYKFYYSPWVTKLSQ